MEDKETTVSEVTNDDSQMKLAKTKHGDRTSMLLLGETVQRLRLQRRLTYRQCATELNLSLMKIYRAHRLYSELFVEKMLKNHSSILTELHNRSELAWKSSMEEYERETTDEDGNTTKNIRALQEGMKLQLENAKFLQSCGYLPKKADEMNVTGEIEHKGKIWDLIKAWDKHMVKSPKKP